MGEWRQRTDSVLFWWQVHFFFCPAEAEGQEGQAGYQDVRRDFEASVQVCLGLGLGLGMAIRGGGSG